MPRPEPRAHPDIQRIDRPRTRLTVDKVRTHLKQLYARFEIGTEETSARTRSAIGSRRSALRPSISG